MSSMSQRKFSVQCYFAQNIPEKPSPEWTRFVCVSDTHNKTDLNKYEYKVPDGDVLLHTGDITEIGKVNQVQNAVNWIKSLPHQYKVVIAGNHDLTLDEPFYEENWDRFHLNKEDSKEAINIIKNAGPGIVYLNEESFTIPDKGIQIWGSPWTPEFYEWAFNGQRGQFLKEKWEQIPRTTDILLTHGPPHNILDKTSGGENAGCVDLLERIKEIKPYVSVFGHIHEGYGVFKKAWKPAGPSESESQDQDNQDRRETIFINASTTNRAYVPGNAAVVFDFPPLNLL